MGLFIYVAYNAKASTIFLNGFLFVVDNVIVYLFIIYFKGKLQPWERVIQILILLIKENMQ